MSGVNQVSLRALEGVFVRQSLEAREAGAEPSRFPASSDCTGPIREAHCREMGCVGISHP